MAQPKEGSIVHVEIHSSDPTRTKEFYGNVFGWTFQDVPELEYSLWKAPAEPAGGLQRQGAKGPMVLDYIYSRDIDATLKRVATAGGRVVEPKKEIPGQGWWALFEEPGGTVMALYQALPRTPASRPTARKAKKGGKRKR